MTLETSERNRLRRLIQVELSLSGPLTAREIAHQVAFTHPGADKTYINGLLYSSPSVFEADGAVPPRWRVVERGTGGGQPDQNAELIGVPGEPPGALSTPTASDGLGKSRPEEGAPTAPSSPGGWQANGVAERALMAATLLDTRPFEMLGSLVPSIPRHLHVTQLGLPSRAQNGLERGGVLTVGDLDDMYVRELRDFRGVGRGTSLGILEGLLESEALYASTPLHDEAEHSVSIDSIVEASLHKRPEPASDLIEDLRLVADWFVTIGRPDQLLLNSSHEALPEFVTNSLSTIVTATARDLADPTRPSAASLVSQSLLSLGERDLGVLRRRLFSSPPMTLDAVGGEVGLTRERVRQIVNAAQGTLIAGWDEDPMMAGLANAIRDRVGFVLPLQELLEAFPALREDVPAVGLPLWHVIDQVDDEYEIANGWCVSGTTEQAIQSTIETLKSAADENGVVSVTEAVRELGLVDEGLSGAPGIRSWIAECRLPILVDSILMRTENLPDRAAAVLSVFGRPITAEDLLQEMDVDRTLGSLKNVMATDPRFIRVGMGLWGLSAWGMDEYTGIRDLIRGALDQAGGEAGIEDLASDLAARFGVAPNSVRTYAASPPFELSAGVVRFATISRSVVEVSHRPVRKLFRVDGSWKLRVTITGDHLRGSGFAIPAGFASRVGLRRGESVQMESRLGSQAMRWTAPQPSLGTIRRFLVELGAVDGQEVFLVVTDNWFDVEMVPPLGEEPLGVAMALAGLPLDSGDPIPALSRAVEISDDSSALVLIDTLIARGDADIAHLLTPWAHDPGRGRTAEGADVDTLMELLR